jgi:ubiquinone biosynthesis protein
VIFTLSHLIRLGGVGLVCAREGLFGLVDRASLPPQLRLVWRLGRLIERPSTVDAKQRLSTTVMGLGPAYVKLGQFLATRSDVVGPALARDLRSLQGSMPPFSRAEAEEVVAAALDRKLCDAFVTFGPAVAAASIAQVHRAEIETPSGRRAVALKLLRPGMERRFEVDLAAFRFVARSAERWSAEARRLRLVEVVETLARSVAFEMDLRLEAAALSEMAENIKDDRDSRCPWWNGTIPPAMC